VKPHRVFLSTDTVPYRMPAGINPFTYRETRPLRHRAKWVTRGTTTDLYVSKMASSQEEVVRLARAWLARENKAEVRYIDTTDSPERYGYSHEAPVPIEKTPAPQLEREIAETLAPSGRIVEGHGWVPHGSKAVRGRIVPGRGWVPYK
jgi:hypothetical protein